MNVLALFTKLSSGTLIQPQASLVVQRGYGIIGDCHAAVGSPRQLLLTSEPVLQQFGLVPGALHENIVVDGCIESIASGQVVQIGSDALVRLTFLCEPCATVEKLRPGLLKQIQGQRGRLGMVVRSGVIRIGDRLSLSSQRFPPLSELPKERFAEFIARVPPGTVVRTCDIVLALGVLRSYYRAIPTLIKKAPSGLPVHRIVDIEGNLIIRHIPEQRSLLQAEGIAIVGDRVLPSFIWDARHFHSLGS